jgi:two-component sensor histidine kinase
MSTSPSRQHILALYHNLLRVSKQTPDPNFSAYIARRTRDAFRANKAVTDSTHISDLVQKAETELARARRAAAVAVLYKEYDLVV